MGTAVRVDADSPTGYFEGVTAATVSGENSGISWNFVAPRFAGGAIDPENRLSIRDGSVYDPKSAQMVSGYQDVGITGLDQSGRFALGLSSGFLFNVPSSIMRWLSSETADKYQRGDAYNSGLSIGILGSLWYGSGEYTLATSAGRVRTGYMIAGDVVGVAQSGYAGYRSVAYGDSFSPMNLLGFVPTVGWAMGAARGVRRGYTGGVASMLDESRKGKAEKGSRKGEQKRGAEKGSRKGEQKRGQVSLIGHLGETKRPDPFFSPRLK